MASVLRVSEAASIGLHAMVVLAAKPKKLLSNKQIAVTLGVSEAHLSKVLQQLARAGFLRGTRGPGGGFTIQPGAEDKTLLEVYEAIEGPLRSHKCLLSSACGGKNCIFGKLLSSLDNEARKYLAKATLADVSKGYTLPKVAPLG